jgi:hypothetical protein
LENVGNVCFQVPLLPLFLVILRRLLCSELVLEGMLVWFLPEKKTEIA